MAWLFSDRLAGDHYAMVLDAVFHNDLARLRSGHGPADMAVVKRMALNLPTQGRPIMSLKNRRDRAEWNGAYLAQVIQQTTWTFTRSP